MVETRDSTEMGMFNTARRLFPVRSFNYAAGKLATKCSCETYFESNTAVADHDLGVLEAN